jgi:glyoxylase-like metal-dependent hydrolase (beta-lactamase superfamily II)
VKELILIFLLLKLTPLVMAEDIKFSIIKTGSAHSLEGMIYEKGSFFNTIDINHSAFMIEMNGEKILFETGLGKDIHSQFDSDMPWWAKPIFSYRYSKSVKDQIGDLEIKKIFLSHSHWDHASGIKDFPTASTYMSKKEFKELKHLVKNRTFPSQFEGASLKSFEWVNGPFLNFEKYYDIFGDKRVVLVPLGGHSHGSVGLLVIGKKKKLFLVGDAVWTNRQLQGIQHKFYISSLLVDGNRDETMESIKKIIKIQDLGFTIVPTHDFYVQERIGYYPKTMIIE